MFIMNISIILDRRLIKKWFVAKDVNSALSDKVRQLSMYYYNVTTNHNDKFKFIDFIKLNGVEAFFDKMKKSCCMEEVSLNDLVNNYGINDLKECYDIILDIDESNETYLDNQITSIFEDFNDGMIDLKTAVNEYKKIGLEFPRNTPIEFNDKEKIYAIDSSMALDCEYHSFFMLFNHEEEAIAIKNILDKGSIGKGMFKYNVISAFLSHLYIGGDCGVEGLYKYKGRITFIPGPTYLGEDEY